MRERDWYQRLAELHTLIVPRYQALGLPIPDYQDLQHQICEYHKYAQIKRGLKTRLKREYKPPKPPKPAKPAKPVKAKRARKAAAVAAETASAVIAEAVTAPTTEADTLPTVSASATTAPATIAAESTPAVAQIDSGNFEKEYVFPRAENTKSSTDNEPENPNQKPITHQIDFAAETLPPALLPLTTLLRWVCWRWEWRVSKEGEGKWTKPPLQPDNGRYAKNNDPSTWGTYDDAVKRVISGGADGIGLCLFDIAIGAVDLDDCRDPVTGVISDWAHKLMRRAPAGTYCEVTVSGAGLRLIGSAFGPEMHRKFPAGDGKGSFELYRNTARYITMSGRVFDA
jgi:hypothetical protein